MGDLVKKKNSAKFEDFLCHYQHQEGGGNFDVS